MNNEPENLEKLLLKKLLDNNLKDTEVYAFIERYFNIIYNKNEEMPIECDVKELYDFLQMFNNQNVFKAGIIYGVLKMLRMYQYQQQEYKDLETDMKHDSYDSILQVLDHTSKTFNELVVLCNIPTPLLINNLSEMYKKGYIILRKVGNTKYYRLNAKGQKLKMCKKENNIL